MTVVTEAPKPLLAVRGLTVVRGTQEVLKEVSFEIAAGECVAVVGPNGAGKTTLLLAMLGLVPTQEGEVSLEGKPFKTFRRKALARRMAYVAQQYEGFSGFTVADMVAAGRYAHTDTFAMHTPFDRQVIEESLATCGLNELRDRIVSQLSGGERQKVWLAAAMAQQSDILLLDEPTASLDPKHLKELIMTLHRLLQLGKTLIFVCHDLNPAVAMKARVLALRTGKLLYDEPMSDFLCEQHLDAVFGTSFDRAPTPSGETRIYPKLQ